MGTRLMTPEAARRVARAHPGSGFARRSARASHNNSQLDAQSRAARDKEEQSQNRGSGYGTTHADQSSAAAIESGRKQTAGEDQCSHCTPENICAHHANSWAW